MNWDWDLFKPRKDGSFEGLFEHVYIPRAAGHGGRTAAGAMVVVCQDEDLADQARSASVQASLMAIVRFHGVYNHSWDFEGAEDDLCGYLRLSRPRRAARGCLLETDISRPNGIPLLLWCMVC